MDGTIVIAFDAAFAANLWIQLQFATDLMTKFTAVFVMADFGKYYFECFSCIEKELPSEFIP